MFETHLLNENGLSEMGKFKGGMVATCKEVMGLMPEGREKALFKTKIEEAVFYGAKSIAGKEGNYKEIINFDK